MKNRILKTLAIIGVAALGFAQPAAAVNIVFVTHTNSVDIVATDLGSDIIAAWDFDITFNPSMAVVSAVTDNQLGLTNIDTDFGWIDMGGGLLDTWEVSFLSDADLDALQNSDPLKLLTITFSFGTEFDLAKEGNFAFIWDEFNDVKCARNQVCFPVQTPEPGTLALLGLGILGMAVGRRRRES